MYFTQQRIPIIYAPVLPILNVPAIIVSALKKSIQQYQSFFVNQLTQTAGKPKGLVEGSQTKLFKKNSLKLASQEEQKNSNTMETEFKKEFENLAFEKKNQDKQKTKRQSFLRAKTNIIEVLEALSKDEPELESASEEQPDELEEQINYKNKSSSTIQDLRKPTKKNKKIKKVNINNFESKRSKPTYFVTIPTISILETIQLPKLHIDKQQIRRKKQGLLERLVIPSFQKEKIFISRQKRQMKKLL